MAFDPDAYLAQKAQEKVAAPTQQSSFDPDSYLASKQAPAEITKTHSFLDSLTNPFGIEPVVNGAAHAGLDALKNAVLNGQVNLADIASTYAKYRDQDRAENQASSDANPISSLAGNIAGGVMVAPTEAAATLGNAIRTGAAFGGATAAGNDLSEGKSLGDTANDALAGAGEGMLTAGVLHGAGTALGALGKSSFLKKPIQAFQQGLKGNNYLTDEGAKAIQQKGEDAAIALGNLALNTNKTSGKALGDALAEIQGKNLDISDIKDRLEQTIAQLQDSNDPEAQRDVEKLQALYDNVFKGKEQPITTNSVIPEKTIPGKPSAEDKILAKQSLLQAQENALPKGAETDIVPSTDDEGNPFLNLVKKLPGEDEANPKVSINKTLPNVPGTPDEVIPGGLGPDKTQMVRLGGVNPNATPVSAARDLQSTLTRFGGVSDNPGSTLTTTLGQNNAKLAAQDLGEQVNNLSSKVQNAKKNVTLSYQALKDLGVPDTAFRKNPITGEMELLPQVENKLGNLIRQSGRGYETSSGMNASNRLTSALDKISEVDPENAEAVRSQVEDAALNNELLQKAQGFNFTNESTWFKQGTISAANLAGNVVSKVAGSVNAPEIIQGAKSLLATGSPTAMKLASELGTALKQTGVQRNATLFSLMQQPGYRELLKQHIPGLGGDDNPPQ